MITDELYHDDLDSMTFGRKDQNELYHHGIKGMEHGKRRFQNEDGSLTMAGRRRYGVGNPKIGVNVEVTDSGTGSRAAGAAAGYNAVVKPSGKSGGGSFNKTSAVNRQTFASSNRPQYSPRPTTGVSQATRSLASNQISNINQRAANRVASNANSGKKAADNLFSRIGNAATGAFNSAKQWTNQAAQDVANTATNAYNGAREIAGQVGDWVGDRAQDVGEFVDKNITGNSARNNANELNRAANATGNSTADNLRNQATQQQEKANNSLFGRIGNAANAVGDWVGDRAQDVAGAATNAYNGARDVAANVGDWVGDRARDVDQAAQNLGRSISNADEKKAAEDAQAAADRQLMLARANSGYVTPDGNEYIGRLQDALNVNSADRAAAEAQKAYENHPLTKAESAVNAAGNWLGDRARDVGNFVGDRANDVAGAATNAYNGAKGWLGDRAQDVSNWFTGEKNLQNAYDAANSAVAKGAEANRLEQESRNNYEGLTDGTFSPNADAAARLRAERQNDTEQAREYANAYENAPRQVINRGLEGAKDWVGDRVNDVTGAAQNVYNGAKDWVGDRAQDVAGAATNAFNGVRDWGNQAIENVRNGSVANDVADWGKQAYGDASQWVGNAARDVGATANKVGNAIGGAATGAYNGVGQFAGNTMQGIRDALNGVSGDKQVAFLRGQLSNPNLSDSEKVDIQRMLDQQIDYDRQTKGIGAKANRAYNDASRWVGNAANDVGRTATNAYNDASRWVGNAANDVSRTATNAYNDASRWVGNAARDVGNWTNNAARDVGGWTSQAARDVANWGSGAINSGRQAIDNLFNGGNQKKKKR